MKIEKLTENKIRIIIKQEDMDGDQLSELTDLLAQHKRSLDLA